VLDTLATLQSFQAFRNARAVSISKKKIKILSKFKRIVRVTNVLRDFSQYLYVKALNKQR
jgi:hypothetical protein